MLTIRMQRLGRKGHPTYRVVVQDVRQTPTSGKYVALLGSYDPHAKTTTLVREKAEFYLKNGAQPSDRVIRLFTAEGITLPAWVKPPSEHTRGIRKPDKLRKNQPQEEASAEEEAPVEDEAAKETEAPEAPIAEEPAAEQPVEESEPSDVPAEEVSADESEEPAPADESKSADESTEEAPAKDAKK